MSEQPSYFEMQLEGLFEQLDGTSHTHGLDIRAPGEDDGASVPTYSEGEVARMEDQIYAAEHREQELINIQEMLVEAGGVSRDMASGFKEVLPEGMALESFTAFPTQTNYKMSLEFIGAAIGAVALAGTVALLGGIGYMVWKIVKFRKRLPDSKLDRQVTAAVNTVEDKLRTAIADLKHLFPDLVHQDLSWKREDGIIQAAIVQGAQEIDIEMLTGHYKSLSALAGNDCVRQSESIAEFFNKSIFPQLDKVIKAGTGKDIEDVSQKLQDFKFDDLVSKHLETFGHDKKLSFQNSAGVLEAFRMKYTAPVISGQVATRLGNISVAAAGMDDNVIKTMFKSQDAMQGLGQKINSYEKRIDGNKELSEDYVKQLKVLLQKARGPLNSMVEVFTITEIEVNSHKRCSKIKAGTVANGFKAVSEHYKEQSKNDPDKAREYKGCVQHLKKLFGPILDSFTS